MKYLTGIQALNIPCSLNTAGDWHQSALQWNTLQIADSQDSLWGDYGIEGPKTVPEHQEMIYVANHIRALLDMLYLQDFSNCKGMRRDYIDNDSYNIELFEQVYKMRKLPYWNLIDKFMEKEYMLRWLNYKEVHNNEG